MRTVVPNTRYDHDADISAAQNKTGANWRASFTAAMSRASAYGLLS